MTMLLAPPASPSQSDEQLLTGVVDRLLAVPSVGLPPAAAAERLRVVLVQAERLTAVVADGVLDLANRELFALDGAGSATGWLRAQQVGGQPGRLAFARRVAARPLVSATLAAGRLGARAAEQLCAALDRVPEHVDEATVVAVLLDGVPDLLREARGAGLDTQAEHIAGVLAAAAGATGASPAERLEPAFVLLAEQLPPSQLTRALGHLLDALMPAEHLDRHQHLHDNQYLDVHRLPGGGWHLSGLLDVETGQLLDGALDHRLPPPEAGLRAGRSRADALRQLLDDLPAAGPASGPSEGAGDSTPGTSAGATGSAASDSSPGPGPGPGTDPGTSAGRAAGTAREPQLTVIVGLPALLGSPGALPGRFADGTSLPVQTVQRLGCGSALTAVLLDAAGKPVAASGTHRHATRRERRALHAQRGDRCAEHGCDRPGTIPHHVTPWWLAHRTRLDDLVPLCSSSHHHLHEGGRTLRLRDGRYINPTGWTQGPAP